MEPWLLALLIKPLAVIGIAVAYYVIVYKGAEALKSLFPDGKLKDELFRERGTYDTRPPTKDD